MAGRDAVDAVDQLGCSPLPASSMAPAMEEMRSPELRRSASLADEREMAENAEKKTVLYDLCSEYLKNDVYSLQRSLVNHVEYTLARRRYKFDNMSFYQATAHSVRDRLLERWVDTQQFYAKRDVKRMYYLSVEYLIGRSLQNAMFNLGLDSQYAEALSQLGYDMENIVREEGDPGLGNGGLGRLASCFLDSLATNAFPAWGYGIRYAPARAAPAPPGGAPGPGPDRDEETQSYSSAR